jgi:two-component system nitrogen regulation sensor histidine kinase NtrY
LIPLAGYFSSLRASLTRARIPPAAAAVAALLILLGVSRAVHSVLVSSYENRWDQVSDGQCRANLSLAIARFSQEQQSLRRLVEDLAASPEVQAYFLNKGSDRSPLFDRLSQLSREEGVGIDVYDGRGELAAWEGPSGPVTSGDVARALGGRTFTYVVRTPVSSLLMIGIPIRTGDTVRGVGVIRRIIDSSAPLNNPLLRQEAVDELLSRELGTTVEFSFAGEGETVNDARYCSGPMYGLDSTFLGTVSVLRPARVMFLDSLGNLFQRIDAALSVLLLLFAGWAAARLVASVRSVPLGAGLITVLIWSLRFSLLWLDVPSGFLSGGAFDPGLFASKFGFGLAKSIGELTISTVALALNVAMVVRLSIRKPASSRPVRSVARPARYVAALAATLLLFWILRGYAAAIRSGVFDSGLTYFDARVLLPPRGLVFMVFDFYLLGACTIVAGIALALAVARWCVPQEGGKGLTAGFFAAGGLFAVIAVVFGMIQETPLMSTLYRFFFGSGVLLASWEYRKLSAAGDNDAVRRYVLFILAASVVMLYPLLDDYVHEKDRGRIEVFAAEELKPVDVWLKHVVEEGLQGFESDDYRERLSEGDAGDVAGIAFERWSSSLACSQGYDAMFTVIDPYGREASRFVIGSSIAGMTEADTSLPLSSQTIIRVRNIGTGVNALKVYSGSMPLLGADSVLLGHVRVVVAAGQQALFRGETPTILRGSSEASMESFYRRVTLSEYRDGILLTSNNPLVPIARTLPEPVNEAFADSTRSSLWANEEINGDHFETFFVRRGPTGIVSLGLKELGPTWHIVGLVKLGAGWAIVALLLISWWRIVRWRRGVAYRMTFRDRLLLALLVTAIVPLTFVAFYARVYEGEQQMETLEQRLDEETQGVIYNITDHPAQGVTVPAFPDTPLKAEELASDIGTDFNIYTDNQLRVSSRPTLYDVGILDTRLSGNVYSKIVLGGKRFVIQTEKIGSVEYSVGYRPILDANQNIIGVVSVPTLFRSEESEEQAARRNALLLGTYAAVLVLVLVIAASFASRIAAPVQKLTEATRKVAKGELNVHVTHAGAEGEISELIRAFDQMTHDLRTSREDLVRYERELAWKEMAKQVAHEIKNPLTPMRLSIQHLRRTYQDGAEHFGEILDNVTKTVIEQIDTLSRIASEFSHFARMPRRNLDRLDIARIIEEAVRLFSQESSVVFDLQIEDGIPQIIADREELRRALINIIRNGIQAMDGAGSILIRGSSAGGGVAVSVTDFGKGVPADMIDKLFMPNFSTKTDGMGLGLAIVKKTIEDLLGRVTLKSEVGKGTTVFVWLPAADREGTGPA